MFTRKVNNNFAAFYCKAKEYKWTRHKYISFSARLGKSTDVTVCVEYCLYSAAMFGIAFFRKFRHKSRQLIVEY